MAIKFNCSTCGQELTVKDELAGKQGKCPGCKNVVTVPSLTASKSASTKKSQPADLIEDDEEVAPIEDDDEDRPKKKKSTRALDDDDEEEDEPRRKKKSR